MTDALTRSGEAGKPVLPVTEQLAADYLLGSQDYPGQADPHVWMDVSAWLRALDVVRVGLAALRPDLAASFSRSEEHTSELQSLMRISYAVFCLKKKNNICHMFTNNITTHYII